MSPISRIVSVWAATLLACVPVSSRQLSFERLDVPVGEATVALGSADLNRDGLVDLVAAGEEVLVLLNRGEARFELSSRIAAGRNPVDLAVGDIDGDRHVDLAVANHETDYATLLFGGPDGTFSRRSYSRFRVGVSPHPHAVLLVDVTGDGAVDLLVDDRDAEGIRVFAGLGNGRFYDRPQPVSVGGDPYRGMSVAHVDDDAAWDLITPNPRAVAVLAGDGTGGFEDLHTVNPGFNPFSALAADLNGDGLIDLAAGSGEGRGVLVTWLGNRAGSFDAPVRYPLGRGPITLTAVDLTDDGAVEILASSYMGGEIAILVGGASPELQRIELDGHPYGFALGDFDGDERTDFAVANDGADHIAVFLVR